MAGRAPNPRLTLFAGRRR